MRCPLACGHAVGLYHVSHGDVVQSEAVPSPGSGRMAVRSTGISSGMDIVSNGPARVVDDFHVLYVLPRIQEEGTGDLAATSSLMGGYSESD